VLARNVSSGEAEGYSGVIPIYYNPVVDTYFDTANDYDTGGVVRRIDGLNSYGYTGGWMNIGYNSGYAFDNWMLFHNLGIPQGATINAAHIAIQYYARESYNVFTVIYAHDVDTSSYPNDSQLIRSGTVPSGDGWYLTTANQSWNLQPKGDDATEDSDDIAHVIQEVINRPGWSSGNDLCIVLKGTGSDYKQIAADARYGLARPRLYVNYTG
jgi:hypothetical protein